MTRSPDADMYGSVEDSGYEMDVPTPVPGRNGIRRTQTFLNIMDMVGPQKDRKTKANPTPSGE